MQPMHKQKSMNIAMTVWLGIDQQFTRQKGDMGLIV